tara:strand:+ start:1278 stop:1907 length:630 start_codon:yes stop_codon:yes gene_type:complete
LGSKDWDSKDCVSMQKLLFSNRRKIIMPHDEEGLEFLNNMNGEEAMLGEIKQLKVTRNELLYLSDSVTLLLEHTSNEGRVHIPARQLMPSAGVPVPIELIQTIGLGFVTIADEGNTTNTTILNVTIGDLYLLRECCQSFIKINNEYVGFNLLNKIYNLILEDVVLQRKFINKITSGLDLTLSSNSREEIMDQLIEKLLKEEKNNDTTTI